MKRVFCLMGVVLACVLFAGPASAQEYPPTTPTTEPGSEVDVRAYGTIRPGQGFTKRDCGFAAGATTTLRLDGTAAGSATAGADGCVVLDVEADDADTVSIDGRAFDVRCGGHTIDVTGASAAGGTLTARNTFVLSCDSSRGLTTTGASVARWSAIAVGLIAVGSVFVLADRRRNRPRSQEG